LLDTVIVDIDGTLVDSNYQHVIAWSRAFRAEGITVPLWRIHRHVGMGADRLVAAVAGEQTERRYGEAVRSRWTQEFSVLLGDITTLPFSRELIESLSARDLRVVLASSALPEHVDHYLDLLGARGPVDAWVTSADVPTTKPAPDLVVAALHRVQAEPEHALLVGDSPWDLLAAGEAGVPGYGVLSGGFCASELHQAGAHAVFGDLDEVNRRIDQLVAPDAGSGQGPAQAGNGPRNVAVDAMPDELRTGSDFQDETDAVVDTGGRVARLDDQESQG
jgi:HAD superfamily hydrolase (TIGR01509 family)